MSIKLEPAPVNDMQQGPRNDNAPRRKRVYVQSCITVIPASTQWKSRASYTLAVTLSLIYDHKRFAPILCSCTYSHSLQLSSSPALSPFHFSGTNKYGS